MGCLLFWLTTGNDADVLISRPHQQIAQVIYIYTKRLNEKRKMLQWYKVLSQIGHSFVIYLPVCSTTSPFNCKMLSFFPCLLKLSFLTSKKLRLDRIREWSVIHIEKRVVVVVVVVGWSGGFLCVCMCVCVSLLWKHH